MMTFYVMKNKRESCLYYWLTIDLIPTEDDDRELSPPYSAKPDESGIDKKFSFAAV